GASYPEPTATLDPATYPEETNGRRSGTQAGRWFHMDADDCGWLPADRVSRTPATWRCCRSDPPPRRSAESMTPTWLLCPDNRETLVPPAAVAATCQIGPCHHSARDCKCDR